MRIVALAAALLLAAEPVLAQTCDGPVRAVGRQNAIMLDGGGIVLRARMNINIDGSARAYHRDNLAGGGLIHLCNAGQVFLPDGTRYQGSESNATCTGRFMQDLARIRQAGWRNPAIGVVNWFGILGRGSVRIAGRVVDAVEPVEQPDGSGFYVSPTTLSDAAFPAADQRRYVEPLTVPAGVIPNQAILRERGIVPGTFGVAIDRRRPGAVPVPFIVGDIGPRMGEGTPALARLVAGAAVDPQMPRSQRFVGQVDGPHVVWVFFKGERAPPPYDASSVRAKAESAFAVWGGPARLRACVTNPRVPAN